MLSPRWVEWDGALISDHTLLQIPVHTYPSRLCLFKLSSCLGTSLQKEGSLVVQILSDQLQGSVHLTQCVLHSDMMNPDPQKTVFALFSGDTWKQLALQVGAIVNIHPPWYVINTSIN